MTARGSKHPGRQDRLETLILEKRASVRRLGGRLPPRAPAPWQPPPGWTAGLTPDGENPDNPTPWYLADLRRRLDATTERRRTEYRTRHTIR